MAPGKNFMEPITTKIFVDTRFFTSVRQTFGQMMVAVFWIWLDSLRCYLAGQLLTLLLAWLAAVNAPCIVIYYEN